ncbi:MAG: NifB/NifX family molybdenum-iron cluster-binding protein, partial [archaeon]
DNALNSKLSKHFGMCNFFAIYQSETKRLEIIKNKNDHSLKNSNISEEIIKYKPDIIFSLGMGQKAISFFNEKQILIKNGNYKILNEVINNLNNLKDIKESCKKES